MHRNFDFHPECCDFIIDDEKAKDTQRRKVTYVSVLYDTSSKQSENSINFNFNFECCDYIIDDERVEESNLPGAIVGRP